MLVGHNVGLNKFDYVKCTTINKKYMAWSPGTVLLQWVRRNLMGYIKV